MNVLIHLLAQATTQSAASKQPGWGEMLMPLVLMGLIMYFIMFRPQGKERKRREGMLSALKKNDKVVTIGGILGTVTSVRDDEVTLKVDESSNIKITFSRSAIQRVVSTGPVESVEVTPTKK